MHGHHGAMQTLAWITDPHLDALSSVQRATFFESIASSKPEGVVITGDIAEGEALLPILEAFDTAIEAVRLLTTSWRRRRQRTPGSPLGARRAADLRA